METVYKIIVLLLLLGILFKLLVPKSIEYATLEDKLNIQKLQNQIDVEKGLCIMTGALSSKK